MGCLMMVEVTTTVAVTIAVVSEIHGCTPTSYVANAKISELLDADETIGLRIAKRHYGEHFSPIVILLR